MKSETAPGEQDPAGSGPDSWTGDLDRDSVPDGTHGNSDGLAAGLVARLSPSLHRPFSRVSERLARLIPGGDTSDGSARGRSEVSAAFEEEVRQAFLAADSIVPASPMRRRPAKPPADRGSAPGAGKAAPVVRPSGRDMGSARRGGPSETHAGVSEPPLRTDREGSRGGEPITADPVTLQPRIRPAVPDAREPVVTPEAARAAGDVTTVAEEQPTIIPPDAPVVAAPTAPGKRTPGATAPDDLLYVPDAVKAASDDFFKGLVRRAGRHP